MHSPEATYRFSTTSMFTSETRGWDAQVSAHGHGVACLPRGEGESSCHLDFDFRLQATGRRALHALQNAPCGSKRSMKSQPSRQLGSNEAANWMEGCNVLAEVSKASDAPTAMLPLLSWLQGAAGFRPLADRCKCSIALMPHSVKVSMTTASLAVSTWICPSSRG